MPDMLVKLYTLPSLEPELARQEAIGVDIRRALSSEKRLVVSWVAQHFNTNFTDECEVAFSHQPLSCFIAVKDNQILGFACHDVTQWNFLGPMGVDERERGRGIGRALLLACLHAMKSQGYGYAIIGWVGPAQFYTNAVGATIIEDSSPGVYRGLLTE